MFRKSPRQVSQKPLPSVPKSPSKSAQHPPIFERSFKPKAKTMLPSIPSPNTLNIPTLNIDTNPNQNNITVPKRVSITVRNHNVQPLEHENFPESPTRIHGSISTRPVRKLPPNLEIQNPFHHRPSQFGLVVAGHSPFKTADSEKSPTSNTEKPARMSKRLSRLENVNYLTATVASVRRMSCKLQKESLEKNFVFSKHQSPGYVYDSHAKEKHSGDKISSSDELSSALSGGSKSSASPLSVGIKPIKLEVTGTSIGSPQIRRSGFCKNQLTRPKNERPNDENVLIKESGKIEEVVEEEEKPINKRIPIMSKEVEEKYGIKLMDSDSSDDEGVENNEEIALDNDQQINLSPLIKLVKPQIDNSPSLQAKGEVLSEEASDEESTVQSTLQKMPFDFNFAQIEEMKRVEFEDIQDLIKKSKPLVATLGGRRILQPEYMKKSGSMCFTELWSNKSSARFSRLMKSDVQHVRVLDEKRDHEYLYRPDKWRETENVKAKIQRIKHESDLENLKNAADAIARNSKLIKKASLPLLKLEHAQSLGTPRSFRGEATPSTNTMQSPRTKNLGILANIVRNEKVQKRESDFRKSARGDGMKMSETPRGSELQYSGRRF